MLKFIEIKNKKNINVSVQDIVSEMTQYILNTRDFCGNETEAFKDICYDLGIEPSDKLKSIIFESVEDKWNRFRIEAKNNQC